MYFKKFEFNENFLMDCKTIYSKKKKKSRMKSIFKFNFQFYYFIFYIQFFLKIYMTNAFFMTNIVNLNVL